LGGVHVIATVSDRWKDFSRSQAQPGSEKKGSNFKFGQSIEQLLNYLRMQNFSDMEREDNPRIFFQINSMTAFGAQQHKARLQ
jgi:hypothetical protein